MNILHHKSWHVRTKSNMERVRRDERKAAEDEQKVLDRQIQAENERRLNTLRARADDRMTTTFGSFSSTAGKDVSISDETGHVNLFQDLEREERKNLGNGNKEYEEEKAKEKREWETKMGIQVYFADNTNDLNKKKEWYEEMPVRRAPDKETKIAEKKKTWNALPDLRAGEKKEEEERERRKRKRKRSSDDEDEDRDRKKHKKHKDKKKKKKKRKHRDSSEERKLEEEYDRERKRKLMELRDERMKRERAEKARTYSLLHPEEEKKKAAEEEKKGKKQKYNSQFNPEFFRQ